MTPIELAKEHGATKGLAGKILFTEEQLEAYNRALVAPYVEALDLAQYQIAAGQEGHIAFSKIKQVLAAHREMFGGE